jgi:hypothetical protein
VADDAAGAVEPPTPELIEAREEAAQHGWMPQAEWEADGRDPARWRDAPEFLEVRRGIARVANEENAQLRARLAVLEAERAADKRQQAEATGKYSLETLKLERKQARADGDWDKVDQLDEKIFAAQQELAKVPPPATMPPGMKETLEAFAGENPWLQKDRDLGDDFAEALRGYLAANVPLDRALNRAKARIVRENPSKFGRTRPTAPMTTMDGTTGPAAASNGKGYHQLTPDSRKWCDEGVAKGRFTREQYLEAARDTPSAWQR